MTDPELGREKRVASSDVALAERVESLRKTLAELAPTIQTLEKKQGATEQKQNTVMTWLKGGAGFIAFDIIITILGLIFGLNLAHVNNNNKAVIAQLQAQQATLDSSIHETCRLYGTFMSFYSPAARDRFVGGPGQYDQLYSTLQLSADRLNCGLKHVVPGT
jgi:hypothetical protein